MPDVRDRQYLITVHKKAKKSGLDLHTYNQLKEQMACVQTDLARLRDPLVPPHRAQVLFDPLAECPVPEGPVGLWSSFKARLKSLRDEMTGGKGGIRRAGDNSKTTAHRI